MKKIKTIIMALLFVMPMKAQKLSTSGQKFIMSHEGCRLERYWDNGAWAIGYGHRMNGKARQHKKIDRRTAARLFHHDVSEAEKHARDIVRKLSWKPSQSFFDGLVSLVYNCGRSGLQTTEFYRRLMLCRSRHGKVNHNDLAYTVAAVKNARIPSGHLGDSVRKRRHAEHLLMLS